MRSVRRLLVALFILLLSVFVLLFVLENRQSISFVYLGWSTPSMPAAIPVLGAFIVGLLVGPLLALRAQRSKRKVRLTS